MHRKALSRCIILNRRFCDFDRDAALLPPSWSKTLVTQGYSGFLPRNLSVGHAFSDMSENLPLYAAT